MREALLAEDLDGFGELLALGWREKKRLSTKVSSTAIDRWYEAARAAGALGGKIAGAGGRGFLLLYCRPQRQPAVRATLRRFGLCELAFDFDFGGARVMPEAGWRGPLAARITGPEPGWDGSWLRRNPNDEAASHPARRELATGR